MEVAVVSRCQARKCWSPHEGAHGTPATIIPPSEYLISAVCAEYLGAQDLAAALYKRAGTTSRAEHHRAVFATSTEFDLIDGLVDDLTDAIYKQLRWAVEAELAGKIEEAAWDFGKVEELVDEAEVRGVDVEAVCRAYGYDDYYPPRLHASDIDGIRELVEFADMKARALFALLKQ